MPSAQKRDLQAFVKHLNKHRKQGKQCDVVFDIGRKSFKAHKNVLMARVNFFARMFSTNMREKSALHVPLDPSIIHPKAFGQVLQYIYTWKIHISEENVESIYRIADYFCIDELCSKAIKYMEANISIHNLERYSSFAIKFALENVVTACGIFMVKNCSFEICAQKLIPSLSYSNLRMLFDEMRHLNRYEEMYHYSVQWILQDQANRCEKLIELLKGIPINRLPLEFLTNVVSHNQLVVGDEQCATLLNDVIANKPQDDILYVLGGSSRFADVSPFCRYSVSKFDSFTNEWSLSSPLKNKLCIFARTVIDKKIFICGKHYDQVPGRIKQFDTTTNEWTTLTHMTRPRRGCGMAALNGCLYIAGGIDTWTNEHVRRVERYSIQDDKWEEVCPMNEARTVLQLVEMNGYLYAISGIRTLSNTVERYDPQTNEWQLTARIRTSPIYENLFSAVLNDRIYTVHGNQYCLFEVYDPVDNEWSEMPTEGIPEHSWCIQLAAFNGQLLALSGFNKNTYKADKSVYRFDFEQSRWIAEKDMNVGRGMSAVAVVKL